MSEKENEEVYESQYLKTKKLLGKCVFCNNDVYTTEPHIEHTDVCVYGDGTSKANTTFSHLETCIKFERK